MQSSGTFWQQDNQYSAADEISDKVPTIVVTEHVPALV